MNGPKHGIFVVNGKAPLTYAVRTANVEMIKTLVVDGKANPNFPNAHGYSSLFFVYEEWRKEDQEWNLHLRFFCAMYSGYFKIVAYRKYK